MKAGAPTWEDVAHWLWRHLGCPGTQWRSSTWCLAPDCCPKGSRATSGVFELIIAEEIIAELISVFGKPYLRARMSDEQAAQNVALLRRPATVVSTGTHLTSVATHPEDDIILSLAVSTQATHLVTGDRRCREVVGTYESVTLISPRDFLTILEADAGEAHAAILRE